MGQLLALIKAGDDDQVADIDVDLDNAKPTPEEAEVYQFITDVMKPGPALLENLRNYKGCSEQIRKAISTPGPETEKEAWNAVCPAVSQLKDIYEFSLKLEAAFPRLLESLAEGDVVANLERKQALSKLTADLLHMVSQFDDLKMCNPAIQNDFSYYRRTLSKLKMNLNSGPPPSEIIVHDELANRMSLFYAYSTPMTKSLTDVTAKNLDANKFSRDGVCQGFALVAAVCYNAVIKGKAIGNKIAYCLRVMVACVVLVDGCSIEGVFVKGGIMNVKAYIKLIQTHGGSDTESLLNALRYTTRHLNDPTTPKSIKAMLAVPGQN